MCPRILVGCSGGQDSLALTLLLADLARAGALAIEIVHVDHAFRATSADAAHGVRALGDELGLPVHVVTLAPDAVARHSGTGPEESLRRERYRAFADVARATGAEAVALAHHQRDQAETVLLHLLRGAGLTGAAGMREWGEIAVPWWPPASNATALCIWRPLLDEPAAEVAAIAAASGMPVFEDETNGDRRFRRNAIRHDVLPLLESVAGGATGNLARFAALAAEEDAAMDLLAADALRGVDDAGELSRSILVALPRALQRRVVRRWLSGAGYDGELSANRVEAILALAASNRTGTRVEIGGGWTVAMRAGVLAASR